MSTWHPIFLTLNDIAYVVFEKNNKKLYHYKNENLYIWLVYML